MRTKIYFVSLISLLFLWPSINVISQSVSPPQVFTPVGFDISERLDNLKTDPPGYRDMSWKEGVIPNKDGFREEFNKPSAHTGPDPVWQSQTSAIRSTATVDQNFPGMPNISGYAPPDTDGDVGPNHYMQMVNCTYQIFDKSGTSLVGPLDNSTLWQGFTGPWSGTNDGDPIVLYDEYADRWIASQFALPNYPSGPFYELIAVSETGDPTGAWYRYAYEFSNMPDYPKFGVWPDGYYFTINQFVPPSLYFGGAGVCVLDRAAMISGNPNAELVMFTTGYGSLLPGDADGATLPPTGSPNYVMSLETNPNHLRIWEVDVDWTNTSNSTMTFVSELYMQSYSYSGISISQPGTSQNLDPLASRLMYRLQYRNFGTHEVMLTNHTVNADGNGQAGVRWYELRNTGSGWSIYQEGTFAPADGDNRWMGSVAMNGNGDIAVGYSVSSGSTYPSIRFAGQTAANSGTGILDVTETSIIEGSNSQTGVNRWGDYSMMSVDPADDETFWYTTEYSNGGWSWRTQIASFTFAPPVVIPPVADFNASPNPVMEGQTVTYTDQSQNNPTSWLWTFEGGDPASSTDQNPVVTYNVIPGLYDVSLTVTNSEGSNTKDEPDYLEVIPYVITYCTSSGNSTASEWIESISLGGTTYPTSDNGGYLDNTATTIQLESGQSVSFIGTPGFSNRSRREFWRVWIDFNVDGNFDAGEEVFAANGKKGTVSGTINIPSGLSGDTRMRVSMKYNATPGSCEHFSYGEVEDYTISFTTPVPLPPVADFEGSPTTVTEGGTVDFTDLSLNDPTSWSWTFNGGTPGTSTDQHPSVVYHTAGTYSVSLTATNALGSNSKTETDYITVNAPGTSYCSSSSQSNALEWIAQVDFDSYSNPSGASFYSDFTGNVIGLTPGASVAVTLTPQFTGKSQREFWRVWIDFNGDYDFDDADEQVFVANNKKDVVIGSFDIPTYASGQTRMRVSMKNGGSPGPCDIFSNGEVEDYTVDFGSAPSRAVSVQYLELRLYPNPATDQLNIEISSKMENINIKVFSALGVIIDEFNTSDRKTQINLSSFTEGIYYIGADDGEQTTLEKFIKK